MLFDLLRNTSTVKLKQEDKIDRCTLMRLTHGDIAGAIHVIYRVYEGTETVCKRNSACIVQTSIE